MSKRTQILLAIVAMMKTALPGAKVMGLDGEEAAPSIVPDGGRVAVRSGDPGEPEFTFGPLTYWYEHRIPVEVAAYRSGGRTGEECLDDMLVAIGAAVAADRTLGGLVDFLDVTAPETDDLVVDNAHPPRAAELILVASYSTTGPLS